MSSFKNSKTKSTSSSKSLKHSLSKSTNNNRKRSGRKQGSTKKNKYLKLKKENKDLKYKIVCRYVHETTYRITLITDLFKKDIFDTIVRDECKKNKMPSTFSFPYKTCLSRIR